jgi:hypothetical protein
MEKEEELFNYLNNKEYPKGSSKDDKPKLRSIAKKYVIKERKLKRDHSPNFFQQMSLLFHKWLSECFNLVDT